MSETINVGIIGAGANTTSRHIPGLQAISDVEIVGVCNRSHESSQRVADEFGIPRIYDNWVDVLDDENINAVVIGTWPYMHSRCSIAAIEVGKHVMTEARMARNALEAHMMLDASQANPDVVAQIVPSPMTLKVDNTIKRLIAEGYLGEILALDIHHAGGFLDEEEGLHWRMNFDYSGYNIQALGIFYEAVLRWVGEATSVMAMGKTYVKMRKDDNGLMRPVRIPQHLDVIADMACGAQLHLQQSTVNGLMQGGGVYLFGSEGTLRFFGGKLYGGKKGDGDLQEIEIPADELGGWRVEEEFVSAIRGEETITHTGFDDGVKYMEFVEAVTRSMAKNRAVPLPLDLDL